MTVTSAEERIIWSADVWSEEELMKVLQAVPALKIVKLDRLLLTTVGLDLIPRVQHRGFKVFADAKIIEIPSKMEDLARLHLHYRPFMLNCMAGGLSHGVLEHENREEIDGLKRFADACHKVGTKPCGVTVLTSKQPYIVQAEFSRETVDQVLYYAEWLLKCGFTDIVCSPQEVKYLRQESRFDSLQLNTPGIRMEGDSVNDQGRVDMPDGAILAGADRLVVGRSLTKDPAGNFPKLLAMVESALLRRGEQHANS